MLFFLFVFFHKQDAKYHYANEMVHLVLLINIPVIMTN